MHVVPIDDPEDQRVLAFRSVRDGARLRDAGLFVGEGRIVVQRLLELRTVTVRELLATEAALAALRLEETADNAITPPGTIYLVQPRVAELIAGYHVHRGCLALAERPASTPASEVIGSGELIVVIDRVANPDNVGGIFRSARAFGVTGVVLTAGTADPLYRKTIRTSMGAVLELPFGEVPDLRAAVAALRTDGVEIFALTPDAAAPALRERIADRRPRRAALIVGEEWAGVDKNALAGSPDLVRIPMAAGVDSLNAGVAGAIGLYELSAARLAPG